MVVYWVVVPPGPLVEEPLAKEAKGVGWCFLSRTYLEGGTWFPSKSGPALLATAFYLAAVGAQRTPRDLVGGSLRENHPESSCVGPRAGASLSVLFYAFSLVLLRGIFDLIISCSFGKLGPPL